MEIIANHPSFILALPMYNEEAYAERCLRTIFPVLDRIKVKNAIVAVNDGSRDQTLSILERMNPEFERLHVVNHPVNRGYGVSIRTAYQFAIEHGDLELLRRNFASPDGAQRLIAQYHRGAEVGELLRIVLAQVRAQDLGLSSHRDPTSPSRPGIVISEVSTHTDLPAVDTIELHNPTAAAVNIGGWFLSDSFNNPRKFVIPSTNIAAGGYVTFTEAYAASRGPALVRDPAKQLHYASAANAVEPPRSRHASAPASHHASPIPATTRWSPSRW